MDKRHAMADAVRKIAQADGLSVKDHKTLLAAATLIEVQVRLLDEARRLTKAA